MNEWIYEWMNDRLNKWITKLKKKQGQRKLRCMKKIKDNEFIDESMNTLLNDCMNEWMNEWMKNWMHYWMIEWTKQITKKVNHCKKKNCKKSIYDMTQRKISKKY